MRATDSTDSPAGHLALTPDLRATLNALAAAARDGDRAARDQVYARLTPTIAQFGHRFRRFGPALEPDEITSVAFLVFVDVIASWPGTDFAPYFLRVFPLRLRRELARLVSMPSAEPATGETPDADLAPRLAVDLIELEAGLPPAARWLLRERLLGDRPLAQLAARHGIPLRTLKRRWRELVALLRLARA